MQSRILLSASLVLVAACATTNSASSDKTDKKAPPKLEKMLIVNNVPFDLAACGPKSQELPEMNDIVLTAVLLSSRPMLVECLLDPKTRGAAAETQVTVKASVDESGATFETAGANLQPGGKACIEAALKRLPLKALAKGAAPVTAQMPFAHGPGSPTVKWGENLASDVVGTVRAGLSQWCECYADVGVNPPPNVSASLKFVPSKPVEVKMKSGNDPLATKLASCLEGKLNAAKYPAAEREVSAPYNFLFLNTNAGQESPDASPETQFFQLDAVRAGKEVDVAFALGTRKNVSGAYDALVQKYKAKPTPALIKELKDKCAAVVASDDGWIGALNSLIETYTRTQTLIGTLRGRDPAWANAEDAAKSRQTATAAELAKAEEQKKNDQGACPKSK